MFLTDRMGHQFSLINSVYSGWVGIVYVVLALGVVVVYLGERMDVYVGVVDVAGVMQPA